MRISTVHRCVVALAIFFGAISAASAASLLVNGSFEDGSEDPDDTPAGYLALGVGSTAITGWEVFNNPVEWIGYLWAASDGTNSVDLDGSFASGIRQTFATTPGETYVVTFDMAGNLSGSPVIKPLRISADGQFATFTVDTTDHQGITYVQQSWSFVADDASATLEFRSLTDDITQNPGGVQGYGAVIDNVSAAAVPAPPAIWLLASALAGVAGIGRRRRCVSG
jgi:choice-of-anchor C domain-containing protein